MTKKANDGVELQSRGATKQRERGRDAAQSAATTAVMRDMNGGRMPTMRSASPTPTTAVVVPPPPMAQATVIRDRSPSPSPKK